jgi:hypothetical protein
VNENEFDQVIRYDPIGGGSLDLWISNADLSILHSFFNPTRLMNPISKEIKYQNFLFFLGTVPKGNLQEPLISQASLFLSLFYTLETSHNEKKRVLSTMIQRAKLSISNFDGYDIFI